MNNKNTDNEELQISINNRKNLLKSLINEAFNNDESVQKFMDDIENDQIPENFVFPKGLIPFLDDIYLKEFSNLHLMYGKVSRQICKQLAEEIKGERVLEVMSGRGWLAKGLMEEGVDIIPTDDYSWLQTEIKELKPLVNVQNMNALEAVNNYKKEVDILLISWPEMNDIAYQCLKKFPKNKKVIFIGELSGCTADEQFAENFKVENKVKYNPWAGLHDGIYIGRCKQIKKKNKIKKGP